MECRRFLPPNLAAITRGTKGLSPRKHYVYIWRDGCTPIYIGSGTKRRAWNTHLPHAEHVKSLANKFNIWIVRENLTKAQAHMIERTLIREHNNTIANQSIPNTRLRPSLRPQTLD